MPAAHLQNTLAGFQNLPSRIPGRAGLLAHDEMVWVDSTAGHMKRRDVRDLLAHLFENKLPPSDNKTKQNAVRARPRARAVTRCVRR